MNILYTRVSTLTQNSDRQLIKQNEYDEVIEDRVSGSVPFAERNGGQQVLHLLNKSAITELTVWEIDRLGRDLADMLNTIRVFTENGVSIHFSNQKLSTLNTDGTPNPISNMIISILGSVSQMERNQIRERQLEGIKIAKAKGKYLGRKKGSKEPLEKFLNKHQKTIKYLRQGMSVRDTAKLAGVHFNTVQKVRNKITLFQDDDMKFK